MIKETKMETETKYFYPGTTGAYNLAATAQTLGGDARGKFATAALQVRPSYTLPRPLSRPYLGPYLGPYLIVRDGRAAGACVWGACGWGAWISRRKETCGACPTPLTPFYL